MGDVARDLRLAFQQQRDGVPPPSCPISAVSSARRWLAASGAIRNNGSPAFWVR
jgi:hypothetical protein